MNSLSTSCSLFLSFLGKLTLKIPWKNLYSDAVVATLDGLYLLVVPGASKCRFEPSCVNESLCILVPVGVLRHSVATSCRSSSSQEAYGIRDGLQKLWHPLRGQSGLKGLRSQLNGSSLHPHLPVMGLKSLPPSPPVALVITVPGESSKRIGWPRLEAGLVHID